MTDLPNGVVMLHGSKAYVSIKEFTDTGGNEAGISSIVDGFGRPNDMTVWIDAVDKWIRNQGQINFDSHEDVVGNIVIVPPPKTEGKTEATITEPTISLIKIAQDSEFFLARWLTGHGRAVGQDVSVFVTDDTESNDDLFDAFHESIKMRADGSDFVFPYTVIKSARLIPVYASITVGKAKMLELGGYDHGWNDASDSGGEGGE